MDANSDPNPHVNWILLHSSVGVKEHSNNVAMSQTVVPFPSTDVPMSPSLCVSNNWCPIHTHDIPTNMKSNAYSYHKVEIKICEGFVSS